MARDLRPKPGSHPAPAAAEPTEIGDDPFDPAENVPSDLDDLTHAEFVEIYRDASENVRFAKEQMWRTVLYFSVGAIAATGYGVVSRWSDPQLIRYLLVIVWLCSVLSVLIILSLQWWQAVEHRKIAYVTSKWSSFSTAARRRKSKGVSDVQRYGMLAAMILYLELVTIAVTRIFTGYL
ncbi:MAG: hypothetical protein NXI18_14235 [Alphaproteobacteria bacterium]|nr:hypothetical protein [Alphaproteobacteria bacterium]